MKYIKRILWFLTGLLAFVLLLHIIEYQRFKNNIVVTNNSVATVRVHFIHGSVAQKDCADQRVRMGGKWGGHVELEIDGQVYGFEIKSRKAGLHVIAEDNPLRYNSFFSKTPLQTWKSQTSRDKITSINIPVNAVTHQKLLTICNAYHQSSPYDYAVWGMRCTASCQEILAEAGIFPRKSQWGYIFYAFYPRLLRRNMLAWAATNRLTVSRQQGIECRDWD
jgi:hypothetical protein